MRFKLGVGRVVVSLALITATAQTASVTRAAVQAAPTALSVRRYLPRIFNNRQCPTTSSQTYDVIPIEGGYYKDNRLTDENADFRLSTLGFVPSGAALSLVDYGGATDANAPKLNGIFEPNRTPAILATYQHRGWNWADTGSNIAPPYGTPGPVVTTWPAHVIDLAVTPGEVLQIPERGIVIWSGNLVALVLYAGERELTIAYARNDSVGGYVVHLLNFCVDANLLSAYRSQLANGHRATGQLPALRVGQRIGTALEPWLTVAVRDGGAFMDPRSRKDWWP